MSGLWAFLEARAERRAARQLLLIDRGLDARSLARMTFERLDPRFFVAFTIIALFGWAYLREDDINTRNLMVGAIIAAFAGAWGYYLGSSNTATQANNRADATTALAHDVLRAQRQGSGAQPETIDVLSDDEKAEIERLVAGKDLAALQALAADLPEAEGKTDPREIATLIVKARRVTR